MQKFIALNVCPSGTTPVQNPRKARSCQPEARFTKDYPLKFRFDGNFLLKSDSIYIVRRVTTVSRAFLACANLCYDLVVVSGTATAERNFDTSWITSLEFELRA